ncbi:MAG: archease [Deltaproteobacteria bacterium]|nr:archease [Deltaproteobacteria bacterium]
MPYRYLEDIAIADAAFEAWGATLEELFAAAADATLNVMVEDLESVVPQEERQLRLEADAIDLLLFELLQEIIFYKDAQCLLLRVADLRIVETDGRFSLSGIARGEAIDPSRHELLVDVKAVTLHRFRVEKAPEGWETTVILDT